MLASARYTLSILIGLALALPSAPGWAAMPWALGAVVVFNAAFKLTMDRAGQATTDMDSAGGFANAALVKRDFVAPEGLVVAPRLRDRRLTRQQRARLVFDKLDADDDGSISTLELEAVLVAWGLPRADAAACLGEVDHSGDGRVSFAEFHEGLAPIWEFACAIVGANELELQRAAGAAPAANQVAPGEA